MALLTKPAPKVDGNGWAAADVNALFNALYDTLGSLSGSPGGGTNQGTLDWTNMSLTAALRPTQTIDTALVAGNTLNPGKQTVNRQTAFSAGSLMTDPTNDKETLGAGAYAAGVLTVDPTKRYHFFSVNDATAYNITSIVGSGAGFVAGQIIVLITKQAGAGSVTITHTDAATVNTVKLRGAGTVVCATTKTCVLGVFVFGDPIGAAVNCWYEEG